MAGLVQMRQCTLLEKLFHPNEPNFLCICDWKFLLRCFLGEVPQASFKLLVGTWLAKLHLNVMA